MFVINLLCCSNVCGHKAGIFAKQGMHECVYVCVSGGRTVRENECVSFSLAVRRLMRLILTGKLIMENLI